MSAVVTVRRFEFSGETSHKFWEVSVAGKVVTVRFGRIGTGGQTQSTDFADPTVAARYAERKVREKLDKGYSQIK
jgi:predicted DNA-binding WGR domain protein